MRAEDYGPPPPGMERPEHPDFEMLRQIVVEALDERVDKAEDKNVEFERLMAEVIDGKSASYMALQRVIRTFGVSDPRDMLVQMEQVLKGSSLYLEGLIAGILFERRRASGE